MDSVPPAPDPLDRLLDRWSDTPEPSPELRREVWRRIALVESHVPQRSFWLVEQLNRPFFATVFVFGCIVTGLFLAEVRVARLQRETSSRLARSYLQLIDPLLRRQGQGTEERK
jgi:hypothetical protein